MITVNIKGGLGNQMFQYACGRALSLKNSERLSLIRTERGTDINRPFSLTNFNIKAEVSPAQKVPLFSRWKERLKQKITGDFHVSYDPKIMELKGAVYLDGYFQSENYFKNYKNEIREDFTLREPWSGNKAVLAEIIRNDQNAVSLHVRRGDYLTHPDFGGIVTKEYYLKAITHIKQHVPDAQFYIFSDDIEWCQNELGLPNNITFVSNPELKDYEEMLLMSLCKHHIIANSSFSWWGAWLNPRIEKHVVAPTRWSNLHEDWYRDIIPVTWTRL